MKLGFVLILVTLFSWSCGKKKSKESSGGETVNVSGQLVVPQGSTAAVPNQLVVLPVTTGMGSGGGLYLS